MYLFTLHINGKDHDLLAVDKIHVDLNWRYLNEYLDQISANDEVLFLKQGHEIIAKNQLAREKLIIYNSEDNYNIIDSVDTEYIEKHQRCQTTHYSKSIFIILAVIY